MNTQAIDKAIRRDRQAIIRDRMAARNRQEDGERTDPTTVKVGDWIGFKCDVEQHAEVIEIRRDSFVVKAPIDGFAGHYIGRSRTHEIYFNEIF